MDTIHVYTEALTKFWVVLFKATSMKYLPRMKLAVTDIVCETNFVTSTHGEAIVWVSTRSSDLQRGNVTSVCAEKTKIF